MTEKDLLREIGNIDEQYILEADPEILNQKSGEADARSHGNSARKGRVSVSQLRRFGTLAAAAVVIVIGIGVYTQVGKYQQGMMDEADISVLPENEAEQLLTEKAASDHLPENEVSVPSQDSIQVSDEQSGDHLQDELTAEPEAAAEAMDMAGEAEPDVTAGGMEMAEDAEPADWNDVQETETESAEKEYEIMTEVLSEQTAEDHGWDEADMQEGLQTCADLSEAAAKAGFSITFSGEEPDPTDCIIQARKDQMIQVYVLDDQRHILYSISKTRDAQAADEPLTTTGDENEIRSAQWKKEGYRYELTIYGKNMDLDEVTALSGQIR